MKICSMCNTLYLLIKCVCLIKISFHCKQIVNHDNVLFSSPFFFLGIMAILFCGIVMSHYTHNNLSPVTQITVQQTFRTIAFVAGELVSKQHNVHGVCLLQK